MKKIENLVAGGGRTLLSASAGNEIINAINSLGGMRAGKGIKISMSDAGPVIELTDQLQESLVLNGNNAGTDTSDEEESQGPGGLRWRGQFDANKNDYKRNDLVWAKGEFIAPLNHNAVIPGHSGLFIATADIPSGVGDIPGETVDTSDPASKQSTSWVPFFRGYGRPRIYDEIESWKMGDVAVVEPLDGQYITSAGMWVATDDIPANQFPISTNSVHAKWYRISMQDETVKYFPTSVTAGTATDGTAVSVTGITVTASSSTVGSFTGGNITGGTMTGAVSGSDPVIGEDGFNFTVGNKVVNMDMTTQRLPDNETVYLQNFTYKDGAGATKERWFLCTDEI